MVVSRLIFLTLYGWAGAQTAACFRYPSGFLFPEKARLEQEISNLDGSYLPQWENEESVPVLIGLYIESLYSIRASDMSFELDLYLRQSWYDPRLRHNFTEPITINRRHLQKRMWTPDIYFPNAKMATVQTVTKPNKLIMVYPDGHVHYSSRVTTTVACNMNLRNYPMDIQDCNLRIMSYTHESSELNLIWFPNHSITHNPFIELPEMKIMSSGAGYCDGVYVYGQTQNTELLGNFSCLLAKVRFRRQVGYHMVQTYIPTGLIVIISWISFWIDATAIPARISLSFTTLLALTTMSAGVRMSLPPVAYAKAIDYWVGMCMLFVFGALLEFALVNSLMRKAMKIEERLIREQDPDDTCGSSVLFRKTTLARNGSHAGKIVEQKESIISNPTEGFTLRTELAKKFRGRAEFVDFVARILFPGVFLVFNLGYWFIFSSA